MKKEHSIAEFIKKTSTISTIAIVFSLIIAITILVSSYKTSNLNEERVRLNELSQQLKYGSDYLTTQIRFYAVTGEGKYYDNYLKEVNETKSRDSALEGIKAIGIKKETADIIDIALSNSNNLIKLEEEAAEASKLGDKIKAISCVFGNDYVDRKNEIDDKVKEFQEAVSKEANEKVKQAKNQLIFFIALLNIALLLLLFNNIDNYKNTKKKVISPILKIKDDFEMLSEGNLNIDINLKEDDTEIGILVSSIKKTQNMLNEYVGDISKVLGRISQKDITVTVDKEYIGDFSSIRESLNTIIMSLNDVLSNISNSSNEVAISAEQMSDGAQSLSEGAMNESSSIQELVAMVSKMSDNLEKNMKNTEMVNLTTKNTVDELLKSNDKIKDIITAMNIIESTSKSIANVINVINDIADETNLLALNASIEAVRAGEYGKGFAVVANQVKILAKQSSDAAKNSTELIGDSIKAVNNGTKVINETIKAIEDTMEKSKQVVIEIDGISESTKKQSNELNQLLKITEEISKGLETTSATAEESAASSEELSSQVEILNNMIGEFKLKK